MSRIRVEKSSTICAQHLNRFLRSNGALSDHLLRPLDCFRHRIRMKILNHTLRTKEKRSDEGDRRKDVQSRACQVDPKIADAIHLLACEPAHQSNRNRYADRGGRKV